jgi:hypothetical protein
MVDGKRNAMPSPFCSVYVNMRKKREKESKKKFKEKEIRKQHFHHRLNKSTKVVTIPAKTPTTLTTLHLVYPSKDFLVINGSDNVSPLKEYKTMPVMNAIIE